mmetsp:Transcript_1112/g.1263  ORF Transcript_1112/g.1263 Transcript_1112/m.1263 type:complete len:419 (-) Transcript_1112:62-1318(-)
MSSTDPAKVLAHRPKPKPVSFNKRDLILYALGVGSSDLKFTYEGDSNFGALPTYSTVLPFKGTSSDIVQFGASMEFVPGIEINPAMVVHGGQETEILSYPLPTEGEFLNIGKPIALYDKRSGAVLVEEILTVDAKTKKPLFRNVQSTFIRGAGGFGGDKGPNAKGLHKPPNRAPDKSKEYTTNSFQAMLYRLSGDYNPLHADPGFATSVGFPGPILHGLCTYGFCCRAIMESWCDNDVNRFKKIGVRFVSPVMPGDTLITDMWKVSETKIVFITRVKGGKVVVGNAYAELNPASKGAKPSAGPAPSLKSDAVFKAIGAALKNDTSLAGRINAVYRFNLKYKGGQAVYTLDLKGGPGRVIVGPGPKPDCTITISDNDYFNMATGKLNAMQAFMQGKLKISGNMGLAQKLNIITAAASKL